MASVIRRVGSGIRIPETGITRRGIGISSFRSGAKICHAFGFKDEKFGYRNEISDEKTYLVPTLINVRLAVLKNLKCLQPNKELNNSKGLTVSCGVNRTNLQKWSRMAQHNRAALDAMNPSSDESGKEEPAGKEEKEGKETDPAGNTNNEKEDAGEEKQVSDG